MIILKLWNGTKVNIYNNVTNFLIRKIKIVIILCSPFGLRKRLKKTPDKMFFNAFSINPFTVSTLNQHAQYQTQENFK